MINSNVYWTHGACVSPHMAATQITHVSVSSAFVFQRSYSAVNTFRRSRDVCDSACDNGVFSEVAQRVPGFGAGKSPTLDDSRVVSTLDNRRR